jgi:hypothetical protein
MQSSDTFSANPPQIFSFFTATVAMVTERRHNLGKIKAVRLNLREMMGIKARRRIVPTLNEGHLDF